jgi:hypothetical protein
MASIFDTMKTPSAVSGENPLTAPRAGTTQRIQDLIQGGKQNNQSGLALDTEEEQGALVEAKVGANLVKQEGDMATQRLQQKEQAQNQEFDFQAQDLEERRINSQLEIANKSSDLLMKNSQNFQELDVKKQKSIAMFSMSLARFSQSNYLDELQTEGQRQRLDSETQFREALQTSIFADEEELLKSDLTFRSILNADDRTFKDELAVLDIDISIGLATSRAAGQQASAMYDAAGKVIQGGIQAGAAYAGKSSKADPNTRAGGATG